MSGGVEPPGYDVSILVECDNVRRKGRARARQSFESITAELASARESVEVILGATDDVVPAWLDDLVRTSGLVDHVQSRVLRIAPVGRVGYHPTKHALASYASGRILVFVDIDVLVEPGWLASLLAPFADAAVAGTFGFTRIGPVSSTYDRAISATWIFDPRRPEAGGPEHPFRSNNVAFRADVYAEHPFRSHIGEHRGAGTRLNDELRDAGLRMERVGATTLHPPLSFPADFVAWPLLSGRDRATRPGHPARRGAGRAPLRPKHRLRTLRARGSAAGVRTYEMPVVLLVGGSLRILQLLGVLIGRTRPRLLDRWA